jgi:predicted regulator of Ras-like GTPase activity (Roadblock/LC7/MglB family)
MPYQVLLDRFVDSVSGASGALMLDATGDVIVESGTRGDTQRLIGAYLGIALGQARGALRAQRGGEVLSLVGRFERGSVIVRPLKDGYFLVVALDGSAPVAHALAESARVQERLNAAL